MKLPCIYEWSGFNDERWDTLLDELTVEDMVKMVTGSGLSTIPSGFISKYVYERWSAGK